MMGVAIISILYDENAVDFAGVQRVLSGYRGVEVTGLEGLVVGGRITFHSPETFADAAARVEVDFRRAKAFCALQTEKGRLEAVMLSSSCDHFVMDSYGEVGWVEDDTFGSLVVTKATLEEHMEQQGKEQVKQAAATVGEVGPLLARIAAAMEQRNDGLKELRDKQVDATVYERALDTLAASVEAMADAFSRQADALEQLVERMDATNSHQAAVALYTLEAKQQLERIAAVAEAYHAEVGRPHFVVALGDNAGDRVRTSYGTQHDLWRLVEGWLAGARKGADDGNG